MAEQVERRVSERKPVRFQVKYLYPPPNAAPPSTETLNLSTEGALIQTLDPLPAGASVTFFIVMPEHEVISVRAQVVYTSVANGGPSCAGVHFTHISSDDRAALERLLQSAS
ncbi:MAG: PilZ domain-containing protein [Chloroflexi bacterium]|nr:PilZ domain-containing protein [Chloroflexota bacterium]